MRRSLIVLAALAWFTPGRVAASDCFEASVVEPSPFMGNHGEILKLSDGSLWEVQHEYEYMYAYLPEAIICPRTGMLVVNGTQLDVRRLTSDNTQRDGDKKSTENSESLSEPIESQIEGDFEGWEGETIVKLVNGQIWQQSDYHYEYVYSFMPRVIIYSSGGSIKMMVDGTSEPVTVVRLK